MKKFFQILDGSSLKIIAMIFMVIDHIAAYFIPLSSSFYLPMRLIGRLSFFIFAFLIVEGIRYSKKPINYLLRLLILGIFIDLGTFIFIKEYFGCVLTTFFIGGLTIYFLERTPKFYKLLSIIPFTIGILTGFSFFPLRMQYGPFGLITIFLFYAGLKITEYLSPTFCKGKIDISEFKKSYSFTLTYVLIGVFLNFCFNGLCCHFMNEIYSFLDANDVNFALQSYGLLSSFLLVCYSGKRGINTPIFKWGCYAFFPLQFIIIYLLGLIIL